MLLRQHHRGCSSSGGCSRSSSSSSARAPRTQLVAAATTGCSSSSRSSLSPPSLLPPPCSCPRGDGASLLRAQPRAPQAAAAAAWRRKERAVPPLASSSSSSSTAQQQQQPPEPPQQPPPPPLQVTRANFSEALPVLRASLADAAFVALDCEMSGLFLRGQEDNLLDDVDDRYAKTAASADAFLVTQFGLSLFSWHEPGGSSSTGGGYVEARSFNFHLFPSATDDYDRRFSCQASSLAFLASQGFDFNRMINEGIPFMPLNVRDRALKQATDAQQAAVTPPDAGELDDDELILMQELEETISSWLGGNAATAAAGSASSSSASSGSSAGSSSQPAGDTLYLPAPPPQLMKLQRQLLAAGIGGSRWKQQQPQRSTGSSNGGEQLYVVEQAQPGGGAPAGGGSGVVLRRVTASQVAAAAADDQQARQQRAAAMAGFSCVMELLRDAKKPLVVHNPRFDIAFTLASFVQSPLPKTWGGFKHLVSKWFPGGVYDTKCLARSLTTHTPATASTAPVGPLLPDTSLGGLFRLFNASAATQQPLDNLPEQVTTTRRSQNAILLPTWAAGYAQSLQDADAWLTLPAIRHAPGCEAYATAALADAGLHDELAPADPSDAGGAKPLQQGLAHEAGYDAFMTGLAFVGLLRLHSIANTTTVVLSRWLSQSVPDCPLDFSSVHAMRWRYHFAHSRDIQYAMLSGPDEPPPRSDVVYLSGLKQGTRWIDIQMLFSGLGLGKPGVVLIRGPPAGAYVLMPNQKEAARAIQVLRNDTSWGSLRVMTYAQYWSSKRSKNKQLSDEVSSKQLRVTGQTPAVATAPAEMPAENPSNRVQSSVASPPVRPALQRPASRPSSIR